MKYLIKRTFGGYECNCGYVVTSLIQVFENDVLVFENHTDSHDNDDNEAAGHHWLARKFGIAVQSDECVNFKNSCNPNEVLPPASYNYEMVATHPEHFDYSEGLPYVYMLDIFCNGDLFQKNRIVEDAFWDYQLIEELLNKIQEHSFQFETINLTDSDEDEELDE